MHNLLTFLLLLLHTAEENLLLQHEYESFILPVTARLQLLSEGSEVALLDVRRECVAVLNTSCVK